MTDLTQLDRPLGEYPDDVIGALVRAWAQGEVLEIEYKGQFRACDTPSWGLDYIYRLAPEQMREAAAQLVETLETACVDAYVKLWAKNRAEAIRALPVAEAAPASASEIRAQALREAAAAIDPAVFDHPSVFMGGPSRQAQKTAEMVRGCILTLIDKDQDHE